MHECVFVYEWSRVDLRAPVVLRVKYVARVGLADLLFASCLRYRLPYGIFHTKIEFEKLDYFDYS